MHAEADVDWTKTWFTDQEEKCRERLQFLADICRRTSQPFWAAYLDGRIIAFNRTYCELLGYPEGPGPLRAMDWTMDLTPLEWREPEVKALEYMHLTKQPQIYEKEYIRQDGSRVPVEMLINPVCDFEGNIQYYYAFITDIGDTTDTTDTTECKSTRKAAIEIRLRSKPLSTISSTISGTISSPLIYSCKPKADYTCTFVSREVKTLFGYGPEEFLDNPGFWISHIHPGATPYVLAILSRLLEQDYHSLDYRFQHKDGTYRCMRNVLGLVRDSYGKPQEIVGRWIEITGDK